MNLFHAINVFAQLTQQITPEEIAYKNHVIRMNQQAQILYNALNKSVSIGAARPEARDYANSLRNLAVRYTGLIQQPNTKAAELRTLATQISGIYDTLANNYVDYRYQPMRFIRMALVYIWNFLPKLEIK